MVPKEAQDVFLEKFIQEGGREAIRINSSDLKYDPLDPEKWAFNAFIYTDLGEFEKAKEALEKSTSCSSKHIAIQIAHFRFNQKFHSNLPSDCSLLLTIKQQTIIEPWELYGLTLCLSDACQWKDTLSCYQNLLSRGIAYPQIWYRKSLDLEKLERHVDALDAIKEALILDPNEGGFWYQKCRLLEKLEQFHEALNAIDKALANEPSNSEFWKHKAFLHGELGEYGDGLTAFWVDSIGGDTPAGSLFQKSRSFEKLKQYSEALDAVNSALVHDSSQPLLWYQKSEVQKKLGQFSEALDAINKALDLDPSDSEFWSVKGKILENLDQDSEALDAINKALDLDPTNHMRWVQKCWLYYNRGKLGECEASLRQAEKLDPNSCCVWELKGMLQKDDGQIDKATMCYYRTWFLADNSSKNGHAPKLFSFFTETVDAPLFLNHIMAEVPNLTTFTSWGGLVGLNTLRIKNIFVLLGFLQNEEKLPNWRRVDRLKLQGLIEFLYGHPIGAEATFNEVDNEDEDDLFVQYYLVRSLMNFQPDVSKELEFACKKAKSLLTVSVEVPDENSTFQWYYAGQLFWLQHENLQAAQCFERIPKFLPALYMRFLVAHAMGDHVGCEVWLKKTLEEEKRRYTGSGNLPGQGFLHGVSPFKIDLDHPQLTAPFINYAHFFEIQEALQLVYEWRTTQETKTTLVKDPWKFIDARRPQNISSTTILDLWDFVDSSKSKLGSTEQPQVSSQKLRELETELTQYFDVLPGLEVKEDPLALERNLGQFFNPPDVQKPLDAYKKLVLYHYLQHRLSTPAFLLLTTYVSLRLVQRRDLLATKQGVEGMVKGAIFTAIPTWLASLQLSAYSQALIIGVCGGMLAIIIKFLMLESPVSELGSYGKFKTSFSTFLKSQHKGESKIADEMNEIRSRLEEFLDQTE